MNKLMVWTSCILCILCFIFSLNQIKKIRGLEKTIFQIKQDERNVDVQLDDIGQLPNKTLLSLPQMLWNLNSLIRNYQNQYDHRVVLNSIEATQPQLIDKSQKTLIEQELTINIYDLKDKEDVKRALSMIVRLEHKFPFKIFKIEGFERHIQVNGVVIALRGNKT